MCSIKQKDSKAYGGASILNVDDGKEGKDRFMAGSLFPRTLWAGRRVGPKISLMQLR
jgi:hypothetical protein